MFIFICRNAITAKQAKKLIQLTGLSKNQAISIYTPANSVQSCVEQLQPNHLLIPVFHASPKSNFYQQCRFYGEESANAFFKIYGPTLDKTQLPFGQLKDALALKVQLLLLTDGTPLYIDSLKTLLDKSPHITELFFVDFEIPSETLQSEFETVLAKKTTSITQTNPTKKLNKWLKKFEKLTEQSSTNSENNKQTQAGILASVRHRNGYDYFIQQPYLEKNYDNQQLTVICPDSFSEDSFLNKLLKKPTIITYQQPICPLLKTQILNLAKELLTHNRHQPVGIEKNLLAYYLEILEKAAQYQTVLEATHPKVVSGCFDIAVDGIILQALKRQFNFSWINFQHGLMGQHQMLDRYDFDEYVVWFEETKTLCLNDGFKHPQAFKISPNPLWQKPLTQATTTNPKLESLTNFKSNYDLTGFYSQPTKSFLTPYVLSKTFLQLVNQTINTSNQKLAVFTHPQEKNSPYRFLHSVLPLTAQQLVAINTQGIPSEQSIPLCDTVTSIFSTVLCDAQFRFNKPVSIIDTQYILKACPLDYTQEN